MIFLFDVDGTLTPPREKIEKEFELFFGQWVGYQKSKLNKVFLVTGSDRKKTKSQLTAPLLRLVDGVYQNCGNQLYIRNSLIKESNWKMPSSLHLDILEILESSIWFGKAGKNIEERVGMINISTVGREADTLLRKQYFEWDKIEEERKKIADTLSRKYTELSFDIGGEISIDIYPKGNDKSQVLKDMNGKTIFFGDRCEKGGNDFEIAIMSDRFYNVSGYEETKRIILRNFN
jgi:phosphomannomutase